MHEKEKRKGVVWIVGFHATSALLLLFPLKKQTVTVAILGNMALVLFNLARPRLCLSCRFTHLGRSDETFGPQSRQSRSCCCILLTSYDFLRSVIATGLPSLAVGSISAGVLEECLLPRRRRTFSGDAFVVVVVVFVVVVVLTDG